ncbi:ATP-binding protein [Streptomyces sp. SID2888]|uniref:sensor histidine kinase n=1 Tax=Streptomyces sp. SID2888 TaxID=2690256 RepID=UPI00136CB7A9|nr:ATP-binding protein [Streptomyces sp. SID2888]MYV50488.1 ATP-binding protein [Streptomyces sp. SID2888]
MSVPAPPTPSGPDNAPRSTGVVPLVVLLVTAAAFAGVSAAAPRAARIWTAGLALGAWLCVAAMVAFAFRQLRAARRNAGEQSAEISSLRAQLAQQKAAALHLANTALPAAAKQLREGSAADQDLPGTVPVSDPYLHHIEEAFATLMAEALGHERATRSECDRLQRELTRAADELEVLTGTTLPTAVERLREGTPAEVVLAELQWPQTSFLRMPAEFLVRELAHSERRAAAAQAASAKALSRVQAKSVSMLADLREMQGRHGEEVFGDLLRLDHSTSQLGLMTDRLALLMGGRSSRAWNKPIVMESILRGAVGRIAAYQRVRMHCSTRVAISGYAAEGVMHLLAELMDNAANFSPPIDEVHVYVEERSAGLVVTIEDSGLKMADAAMRHAEEAVSGQVTDLASLQGTRLGLAVVGRLAAKYDINVNFRPSSHGGTGVVVLLPRQLLAQQRGPAPSLPDRPAPAATATPAPAPAVEPPARTRSAPKAKAQPAVRPDRPEPSPSPSETATPNGLPVRAPGRAMAEAEAEAESERRRRKKATDRSARDESGPRGRTTARDAGSQFGAFHRGRRAPSGDGTSDGTATSEPPTAQ